MYVFFARKSGRFRNYFYDWDRKRAAQGFLLLLLFVGVTVGSVFGMYSSNAALLELPFFSQADTDFRSYAASCLAAGKYFLCIFAASTTYFGVLLIPALILLRGYVLGCSVAASFAAASYSGLLSAFFSVGVSAILTVPFLIAAACHSFCGSEKLLLMRFGGQNYPAESGMPLRCRAFTVLSVLLDALYCRSILPRIHF